MRYYLSTAGGVGKRPVVFLSGDSPYASMADRQPVPPPDLHLKDLDTGRLFTLAEGISRAQETAAIWLARVGQDGSSGTHHSLRHTLLELLATSAALDAIKARHGFEGFHVFGHSGGGNLTVGLLELRNDIRCDVPADGQLTHPNPHGIKLVHDKSGDPARQVFDVTDDVGIIVRNRAARILVVTDPQDQVVRIEHQSPFVAKLRAAGGEVDQFFVDTGEESHHATGGHAAVVMHDCTRGASHEVIAADLAEYVAKQLRAKVKPGERGAPPPDLGAQLAGINLMGSDYRNLWLDEPQATLCQNACRTEMKCMAWTYVTPGRQGGQARCWLKDQVPPRTPNDCCTSGIERY
jgi:hypothetical protein